MLDEQDRNRLFSFAHSKGFDFCEIYVETAVRTDLSIFQRVEGVTTSCATGVKVSWNDGERTREFVSHSLSEAALRAAIEGNPASLAPTRFLADQPISSPPLVDKEQAMFSTWTRTLLNERENLLFPYVQYRQIHRRYEVASSAGPAVSGEAYEATFLARWKTAQGTYHFEEGFLQPGGPLMPKFAEDFKESVFHSQHVEKEIPAPAGEISIVFSARAMARLIGLLSQLLEADRLIAGQSALSHYTEPVECPLEIVDRGAGIDQEGTARRNATIWERGRPRLLACTTKDASVLGVAPTGHARRQDFSSPVVACFSHLAVHATEREASLLAAMQNGLWVHDFDVLEWKPHTGKLQILLSHASLVQQGVRRENVLPTVLDRPLWDLLAHCRTLEASPARSGTHLDKDGYRFFVEIETPAALFTPLELTSSSPLAHYW